MSKFLACAALSGFLLAVLPVFAEEPKVDKEKSELYLKEGLKYLGEKNLKLAMDCFQKALQYDPKNIVAMINMADMIRVTRQAPGQIVKAYGEVLKISPNHQAANYYTACVFLDQKRFADALPFLKKAVESKEGLVTIQGTEQVDPMFEIILKTQYGQTLSELNKGEEALKILKPLAEEGKFNNFMGHPDENMKHWAWRGYLLVGYSLSDLKQFNDADKYLSQSLDIQKRMFEGKISAEFDQRRYLFTKLRVPAYGTVQDNGFLNPDYKVTLIKPDKWDFYFVHPEEYPGNEAFYKQRRQFHVGGVIMIDKNKNGEYSIDCQIDIEGIDPDKINYSVGGKPLNLESPKKAMEMMFDSAKEAFVDLKDVQKIEKVKFNNEFTAAYYQFTGTNAKVKEVKRDMAKWIIKTRVYTYFIEIEGDAGSRKKYQKDIAFILGKIKIDF